MRRWVAIDIISREIFKLESGQSLVEYSLLIALIGIVLILSLMILRDRLDNIVTYIINLITSLNFICYWRM